MADRFGCHAQLRAQLNLFPLGTPVEIRSRRGAQLQYRPEEGARRRSSLARHLGLTLLDCMELGSVFGLEPEPDWLRREQL